MIKAMKLRLTLETSPVAKVAIPGPCKQWVPVLRYVKLKKAFWPSSPYVGQNGGNGVDLKAELTELQVTYCRETSSE